MIHKRTLTMATDFQLFYGHYRLLLLDTDNSKLNFVFPRYVLFGATLFSQWEHWDILDGSYFCFISLSSIGFGDIVPGASVSIRLLLYGDQINNQ